MKLKVGVIGSGTGVEQEIGKKSQEIGKEIACMGCILLTGSGSGLPYEAVKGAKEAGGFTIGISPASDLREHAERYKFPTEFFDMLIFTGFGLKGRNVPFIRSCDGVIVISGRIGTLNEFTIAYDEGKVIGVLKGTGGISDSIEDLVKRSGKKGGKVIYESDPRSLVKDLIGGLGF
jgi:uncharacterized protein (TIGR00725 family)